MPAKKVNEKTKVCVFEIEYETTELNFKVKIAAWSKEDALGYLNKMLRHTSYKIRGVSFIANIDAITTQVIEDIVNKSGLKLKEKVSNITPEPKETITSNTKEDETEPKTTTKSTMKKK